MGGPKSPGTRTGNSSILRIEVSMLQLRETSQGGPALARITGSACHGVGAGFLGGPSFQFCPNQLAGIVDQIQEFKKCRGVGLHGE